MENNNSDLKIIGNIGEGSDCNATTHSAEENLNDHFYIKHEKVNNCKA